MGVLFANWPFSHSVQSQADFLLPWEIQQILSILDVLVGLWEQQCELFVGRLEDAESAVQSAIN
jgi:predicted transcriptional regulator